MTDLQPADRFEWERILRRCILPKDTKLVAFTLAQYGDRHGDDVRPGNPRLAAVCGMGESTVRRHTDRLLKLGLIDRIANGGGPNRLAARYRLTIPTDLLDRVPLLDPEELTPLHMGSGVLPVDEGPSPLGSESGVPFSTGVDSSVTPLAIESGDGSRGPSELRSRGEELRSIPGVTPLNSGGNSAHPGEHLPRDQVPPISHHPKPLVSREPHQSLHRTLEAS